MMQEVGIIDAKDTDRQVLAALGLALRCNFLHTGIKLAAVKIGGALVGEDISGILDFLKHHSGPIVLDSFMPQFFPFIDILVIDLFEAESILKRRIGSEEAINEAANALLAQGAKAVLLSGVHLHASDWSHAYWTNGITSFWLTQKSSIKADYPRMNSLLSTAIAAFLALAYSVEDSIVLAKMYVHRALRLAGMGLYHGPFPENQIDLPYLASRPIYNLPQPFKPCPYLGLYPIVDSADWVELLLQLGVKSIQLRIKERTKTLEAEIIRSIALAKNYHAVLFINDYWELALRLGAAAVHLGQADLNKANIDAIRQQGLLLGVSTYCYYEVARAHTLCPSYVAVGPIYPTTSKDLSFAAQGIKGLQRWRRTLTYPLVAIGGINLARMPEVLATGVHGIALISAITAAPDPCKATQQLLDLTESSG